MKERHKGRGREVKKSVDEDQRFDSRQRNKDGMMERKKGKDIKSKRQ